ncbi:MAG: hypothetical protein ACYS9X_14565 [Planctomycetota bacterium]
METLTESEKPPVLACGPARLEVTLRQGEKKALPLTIRNEGGQTLRWSVPHDEAGAGETGGLPAWISMSETSGELASGAENEQQVEVTLDATGLKPGAMEDEIPVYMVDAKGTPVGSLFRVSILLTVAEAEPKELVELGEPDGPDGSRELPDRPEGPDEAKPLAFAVRAGLLFPGGGGREDYDPSTALALAWRPGRSGEALGYEIELGVGITPFTSDSGLETTRMLTGGANALWRFAGDHSRGFQAHLIAGLSLVREKTEDQELGETSNFGMTLNLGAGAVIGGRYDARVGYLILLGSQNADGMASASFGVLF